MKQKHTIPIKSMLGGFVPPNENNMTDEEKRTEIERLQKVINHSRISDLHKMLMYLSNYYTWCNKHGLAPLSWEEFNEVFRLCGYETPEITELKLAEFNEIHRTEPFHKSNDNMDL